MRKKHQGLVMLGILLVVLIAAGCHNEVEPPLVNTVIGDTAAPVETTPGEQDMLRHLAWDVGIPTAFAAVWTAKEALSKQDGRGGPLRFDASIPPPGIALRRAFPDSTGAVLTVCWPGDGIGSD